MPSSKGKPLIEVLFPEDPMPDTTFATRLKSLRKAAGLSVAALARKVNVTVQYIYMIEKGERVPAWEVICEMADALNIGVEEFRETKGDETMKGEKQAERNKVLDAERHARQAEYPALFKCGQCGSHRRTKGDKPKSCGICPNVSRWVRVNE